MEHPLANMIMENTRKGIQIVIEIIPKYFSAWDLGIFRKGLITYYGLRNYTKQDINK